MERPRHDPYTHEWCFMGKWYDHYPADEVKAREEWEIERGERLYQARKDRRAEAWEYQRDKDGYAENV